MPRRIGEPIARRCRGIRADDMLDIGAPFAKMLGIDEPPRQ
jgi:hypothetical protein